VWPESLREPGSVGTRVVSSSGAKVAVSRLEYALVRAAESRDAALEQMIVKTIGATGVDFALLERLLAASRVPAAEQAHLRQLLPSSAA